MIKIFSLLNLKLIYISKLTFMSCALCRACTRTDCEIPTVVILDLLTI